MPSAPVPAVTGNMMLFNSEGVIRKYDTAEDILREFYELRLGFYTKRKAALLKVGGFFWGAGGVMRLRSPCVTEPCARAL
jgi:hypothetical protein